MKSISQPLRITFLGTGTSVGIPVITCSCDVCTSNDPKNQRLRASLLLEWPLGTDSQRATVLVDTSTDLRQQALRSRIQRVDAVLYTHNHFDHVAGLDELRIYNFVHKTSIPLHSNTETLAAIKRMFAYAFQPGARGVPRLELVEIGDRFELLSRTIESVPVEHGAGIVLAYRIDGFGYVTDCSAIPPAAAARLQGLEVLVIDALRRHPHRSHFCLDEALAEIDRLRPRRALLTHLGHDFDHAALSAELPEGVAVAHDGLVVELGGTFN